MFEQSVLIDHPTNKSWSVLVGLSAQMLVLAVAIAIPLVFTDGLPKFEWTKMISVPLPPAPPPAPVHDTVTRRPSSDQTSQTLRVFAPPRIPDRIAHVVDEPAP